MTVDTERLRDLARAATPGPWTWEAYGDPTDPDDPPHQHIMAAGRSPASGKGVADTYHHAVIEKHFVTLPPTWGNKADAEYIAAANPAAILSLLLRLDAAEALLREVHWIQPTIDIEPYCVKCGRIVDDGDAPDCYYATLAPAPAATPERRDG